MLAFGRALPAIRRRVRRDLARPGLPRQKVLAAVVELLAETCVRVGNDEYARANESYGLTTLRDRHVDVAGSRILFSFRGKRGREHRCELRDRRLARVVARCQALPGEQLFQYVAPGGARAAVDSADVNAYLRAASGGEFTAKDFRTWSGTLLAAEELLAQRPARSRSARRRQVNSAIERVAARLHNARAACRKYYVHPELLAAFEAGHLAETFARARRRARLAPGLCGPERDLVAFVELAARAPQKTRQKTERKTWPSPASAAGRRARARERMAS
jgi:DNA topoisomerase-1